MRTLAAVSTVVLLTSAGCHNEAILLSWLAFNATGIGANSALRG